MRYARNVLCTILLCVDIEKKLRKEKVKLDMYLTSIKTKTYERLQAVCGQKPQIEKMKRMGLIKWNEHSCN